MIVLQGVDPNLVRPGWTPLVVLLLLGVALFFLGRSMIKQFGKIDVPADHDPATSAAGASGSASGGSAGARRVADERAVTEPGSHPPIPDLRTQAEATDDTAPPERP